MNKLIKKMLFFDKATSGITLAIIIVLTLTLTAFIHSAKAKKDNGILRTHLSGIQSKSAGLLRLKSIVDSKEKKMARKKTRGVVTILERTIKDLNINAKALKPMEKKRVLNVFENDAQLIVRSMDLNSIVNLLYRIENSPEPIKIKNVSIKTTFENPDRFSLELILSLISRT